MRYRLSEQARRDLKDILVEGILMFGEHQETRYQLSLKQTLDLLSGMPGIGRTSERGHRGEHRFAHGKHTIYHRSEVDGIVIQNVIYSPLITDLWGEK